MNSHLERFNRAIQEESANYHTGALPFTDNFNRLLVDWPDWCNACIVHCGFKKQDVAAAICDIFKDLEINPNASSMQKWVDAYINLIFLIYYRRIYMVF